MFMNFYYQIKIVKFKNATVRYVFIYYLVIRRDICDLSFFLYFLDLMVFVYKYDLATLFQRNTNIRVAWKILLYRMLIVKYNAHVDEASEIFSWNENERMKREDDTRENVFFDGVIILNSSLRAI